MVKIKTIDKIAKTGLAYMKADTYDINPGHEDPEAILLRSTAIHDMELPKTLRAIARAGAGVNNIPIDKCTDAGIVVFNTPGANALAVAELCIAAIFMSSRKVIDGINWVQTLTGADVAEQVEKGKSKFQGPEIYGKRLGVIGLGAIGALVANMAVKLGMEVVGCDPFMSVESALKLSKHVTVVANVKDIYKTCDYISIHVPATPETKGSINDTVFGLMKPGTRFLNFSRAELVDTNAVLKAVENGTLAYYITDFPTEKMLRNKNIIPIPHLGASTPESEDKCACMAVRQVADFLETGTIVNSVNFPAVQLAKPNGTRVFVIHDNIPNILAQITAVFGGAEINIDEIINKSRDKIAITVVDVQTVTDAVLKKIKDIKEVKSIRLIKN